MHFETVVLVTKVSELDVNPHLRPSPVINCSYIQKYSFYLEKDGLVYRGKKYCSIILPVSPGLYSDIFYIACNFGTFLFS